MFRLFVYGTLKRGQANHRLIPPDAKIEKALCGGMLYDLGRFPALALPPSLMLALGTEDCEADAKLSGQPRRDMLRRSIQGELVTFRDPSAWVPSIDRLEGYIPSSPKRSLYIRVLTAAATAGGESVTAWTYAANALPLGSMTPIPDGSWASPRQ